MQKQEKFDNKFEKITLIIQKKQKATENFSVAFDFVTAL
jgi:hypothetical protein